MKFSFKTVLFWLIIFSSPFINLSFINDSKLPITYLIVIFYFLISSNDLCSISLKRLDFYFFIFLFFIFVTISLNMLDNINILSITQFINILLTYSIFKATQLLVSYSKKDNLQILDTWFVFGSYVCLISIFIFLLGLFEEAIPRTTFDFFNNSGNFSKGGIITSFSDEVAARLNSLSPEPSFWAFYSAFNFALGLSIKKKRYPMLFISFLSLILTFSRTGYLMLIVYILFRIWSNNIYLKILIFTIVFCSFFLFLTSFNINYLLNVDDSFRQRFGSLIIGFELFFQNPLIGIGLGRFSSLSQSMGLDYRDVFSLFLNFLVSGGIFTLIFFILFCRNVYYTLAKEFRPVWIIVLTGWLTVSSYNLPFIWVFIGITISINEE